MANARNEMTCNDVANYLFWRPINVASDSLEGAAFGAATGAVSGLMLSYNHYSHQINTNDCIPYAIIGSVLGGIGGGINGAIYGLFKDVPTCSYSSANDSSCTKFIKTFFKGAMKGMFTGITLCASQVTKGNLSRFTSDDLRNAGFVAGFGFVCGAAVGVLDATYTSCFKSVENPAREEKHAVDEKQPASPVKMNSAAADEKSVNKNLLNVNFFAKKKNKKKKHKVKNPLRISDDQLADSVFGQSPRKRF